MRFTLLLFLCLALNLAAGGVIASDRPQLYGFAPAYPTSLPLFASPEFRIQPPLERILRLSLEVKKDGSVGKLTTELRGDSMYVNYVRPYLTSLTFVPASVREKPDRSILPVSVRLRPGVAVPDFYFPVDTNLAVNDLSMFTDAVRSFKVMLPRVLEFPSYSATLHSTDTLEVYPYVLLKIALDEKGQLTDARIDKSTYPTFDHQVLSAVKYARFEPARIKNKGIASEAYLLVSFFPSISYPNQGWKADTAWQAGLLAKAQIRLLPAKLGLLSPPLPRRVPGDTYPRTVAPSLYSRFSAGLNIDSTGTTTSWSLIRMGATERKQVISLLRSMKFFPAIGFDGRLRPYQGLIYITADDQTNIRIDYNWLQDSSR